jgi:hypothetical protein
VPSALVRRAKGRHDDVEKRNVETSHQCKREKHSFLVKILANVEAYEEQETENVGVGAIIDSPRPVIHLRLGLLSCSHPYTN